jgi:hypothetical protein
MSRLDLVNDFNANRSLSIATRTNGTVNGTGVDLANYDGAAVVVFSGTMTDGSVAITIEESADNSAWSAVAAADRIGSLPTIASTDDDTVFEFGYKGILRYLRVVAVTSGATSGGTFGALIVRGQPRVKPA